MYLFRQRKTSKIIKPIQIISMILLVSLFASLMIRWTPIAIVALAIQARLYSASITTNTFLVQTFSSSESLRSQIEQYKSLAENAIADQTYIYQLENRIKELEKLLGYSQTVEYETVVAKILSHSQSGEYTILIDQGSHSQIEKGFAVVVDDGYLIGIVDSVSQYTAVVRLLEDPKTSIPVSILNNDAPSGLLTGQEGFLLEMQYIPQDRLISQGDVVVTSNLFERIPNGLIVGIIYQIITDETSPFKEAFVEPIHKTSEYSTVLVLKTNAVKIYEE